MPLTLQFVPIVGEQRKHQIETIAAVKGREFSTFKVFTKVDIAKQVAVRSLRVVLLRPSLSMLV